MLDVAQIRYAGDEISPGTNQARKFRHDPVDVEHVLDDADADARIERVVRKRQPVVKGVLEERHAAQTAFIEPSTRHRQRDRGNVRADGLAEEPSISDELVTGAATQIEQAATARGGYLLDE